MSRFPDQLPAPATGIRSLFPFLPRGIRGTLAKWIPGTKVNRREQWIRECYTPFSVSERERLFLAIARFCHINRPIEGYYFEFGCHEGKSMRLAYKHFQHLFNFDYVAFDSFEGLPDIANIDAQEIWKKGKLKTAEEEFRALVTGAGMPNEKLTTVRGFFDASLTPELQTKLLPKKAAVVYVDCDLYLSTIPVLEFCRMFFQRGTILVFDDWNCFHGDPNRGERRSFREFLEKYPDLVFEPFVSTNEAQSFIYLGTRAEMEAEEHRFHS